VSVHRESCFESEICAHLAEHGWLCAEGDAAKYDRALALFPEDVLAWVEATQPEEWATLVKNHGASAGETLLKRIRAQLDQRGTLEVLRVGVEMLGLRKEIKLAEFKPAMGLNEAILARYRANRLRVVRQVRYSQHNENCIDLVLFLNGVPVATVELKTDFTQSVTDAEDQYRLDRLPRPKGQTPEPLLGFPSGALVHFAVSNAEVRMTTRLDGPGTLFLPFNQGDHGAAGNPVNTAGGHRTAYMWEQVWERESWLEILGRYLVAPRDDKKRIKDIIFPRYHQLDVTRRLQAAVLRDGVGAKYLIQHSAGSGKTKSIAWTAHFLAELHDSEDRKVFDSVLVVSDRTVIDAQLQDEIFDFQRQTGLVATVKGEGGSKSAELAEALSGTKKVVVCTIQTFPFALAEVRRLAATQGKRFAVIADEAHSSQTGEAASKLKAVLTAEELADLEDGGEVSAEDVLAAQMAARSDEKGITFVAFTATPKNKTLELFGTRPDPTRKPADDNVPLPFHVYSMRQAIEEGFILDVLRNYTSYSLAFKLAHAEAPGDEKPVDGGAALRSIMGWVKLHPYNIAQKVEIVVEHFREQVAPLLGGKAKAMVVLSSRKEAVRWKLAIDRYIRERSYAIGTLVAFSGEVNDSESSPEPFSETSKDLNPQLKGKDIREAFKAPGYQILLVANKFQTGFDQPLLCAMYVDKRLADVQAVQTLSRLNRAYPGKETYVVDFLNDPQDVLKEFRKYYETAELTTTTDPNLVFDLRAKLDAAGLYDDFEVQRVVNVEMNRSAKQGDLLAALEPVHDRIMKRFRAAQAAHRHAEATGVEGGAKAAKEAMDVLVLFKRDLGEYLRLYTFLSQIFDYGNTAIEARAIFYRPLMPLLNFESSRETIDVTRLALTHHVLKHRGTADLPLGGGERSKIDPITHAGAGQVQEKVPAYITEIIARLNDLFAGELTDQDKLVYVRGVLMGKLLESAKLREQAASNTKEQFAASPDLSRELTEAIMSAMDAHQAMSTQALNSEIVRRGLLDILLHHLGLYEGLRGEKAEQLSEPPTG
jgi:type I restriction enzyme, R subunit